GWLPGDRYGMNRLIEGWASLERGVRTAGEAGPGVPLDSVRLRAPVPAPMHLFASPGNFTAHIQEVADQGLAKVDASGKPPLNTAETLGFFIKASGSITGPSDPIEIPVNDYPDRRFDHEGEIAFVMSRRARGVSEADFADYIFGYTIVIDVTLRGGKDGA